jgi:hypothetical protein
MNEATKMKILPDLSVRGSNRTHVEKSTPVNEFDEWFVATGRDGTCQFEGSWYNLICFARNVLASENTRIVDLEYYRPTWRNSAG